MLYERTKSAIAPDDEVMLVAELQDRKNAAVVFLDFMSSEDTAVWRKTVTGAVVEAPSSVCCNYQPDGGRARDNQSEQADDAFVVQGHCRRKGIDPEMRSN